MPKLQTGEVAESVRMRKDSCEQSALNRIGALRRLQRQDEGAIQLAPHFRSFAALCSWESKEHGVSALSPKTLRMHIEALYEGGQAQFLIDIASAANTTSTLKATPPRAAGKREAEKRAEAVLTLTQQYSDLLDRFIKVSKASEVAKTELAKHFQAFGDGRAHLRRVK